MKKFWAVVRLVNQPKTRSLQLEAPDYRQALDDLFFYLNTDTFGVEEYEMFEIVGNDRYVPVACKVKGTMSSPTAATVAATEPVPLTRDMDKKTFSEKLYRSYKDVA